jgi:eukaryotic-like serine/threonine-protein kinase
MSTKIGHFEILSEIAKSLTSAVYKANDPQTSQTVALKAIQLSAFGDRAGELEKCLLDEAQASKVLSHSNIPPIYGAGQIDGQFCAAMEYIQGNSIATMLARKEGFSIWDLLDIGRQVCGGLDHAHSQNVFHFSLEPDKIMCGWDGGVRVLGFGISGAGNFVERMPEVPPILYYMSPEQIRCEPIDARSNLFSLGAIFYEMVTDQKAFDCQDAETLRQCIVENTPVSPIDINPKIHPLLNDLIMKALAKDPGERYQNGRELLDDLEQCKESKPQSAKQTTVAKSSVVVPDVVKAATQAKFIGAPVASTAKPAATASAATGAKQAAAAKPAPFPGASAAKPAPAPAKPAVTKPTAAATAKPAMPPIPPRPLGVKPGQIATARPAQSASTANKGAALEKSAAAAASMSAQPASAPRFKAAGPAAPSASKPSSTADEPTIVPETEEAEFQSSLSHAAEAPKIAVDPMMAEDAPRGGAGVSFSELDEMPPLKEIYIAPPTPAESFDQPLSHAAGVTFQQQPEKPKVDPREIAEKAVKEIKNVPPRLIIYSIAGAAVVILGIAIALVMHIQSLNTDSDAPRATAEQSVPAPAQAAPPQPAPRPQPVAPQPAPSATPFEPSTPEPIAEPAPTRSTYATAHSRSARKKPVAAPAPVIVPGQMAFDSTPQGAQVQIDGRTDASWVTPFTLSGVASGQHSIVISKPGYITDSRTVAVTSGSKAFVSTRLNQLTAALAISSTPAGANVYIDGKDTGKLTPAQISLGGGSHVVLVHKPGYIDETTTAQFTLGQTVSFTPMLRALGNVDDIRTTGKIKKIFGGKDAQGMGTVSVKTQPKGAQVAVNQHMLDKTSPVEFVLDPGNYIVDITMTGYAPIHKVISVDKGGKAVIDEVMQRE